MREPREARERKGGGKGELWGDCRQRSQREYLGEDPSCPHHPAPVSRGQHLSALGSRREVGRAGWATLPSVGGCPRSSPRSSPDRTCPSGCPPSPRSCPSGRAPPAPRRSPGAAAAPGGPPLARFAGAAGCRAGRSGQAAFRSSSTAGARAGSGPWWAWPAGPSGLTPGPRPALSPAPNSGCWRWLLRRASCEASGLQSLQAPRPAPRRSPWGDRAGEIRRRREEETDPKPATSGQRRPASAEVWERAARAPREAGRGGHGRSAAARFSVLPLGGRRARLGGLRAPAAACAAQATIIQLSAPRQPGEAERLVAAAVKAKGFSLFPGTAGKCSLPMAGSPASGVGEGSGMPSAETESALQDPGRAGRTVKREWWPTSRSASPSFCIY